MYSINDTADFIIKTMEKFVDKLYPIDDNGITFNVDTKSVYKRYQVIRLCNYTFAYKLTEYEKICVLDSDLIIMKNIDELFELNAPAGLYLNAKNINANELHIRSKRRHKWFC
jgi:alpha-N-acetylglucosamine transferase